MRSIELSRRRKWRSEHDLIARCSFPQLEAGGVREQALAVFVETFPGSSILGKKQIDIFRKLSHPEIAFHLAIENSSGLFEEKGALQWPANLPPILYLSLTWNEEIDLEEGHQHT